MRRLLIASTVLLMTAAPVHAQLLGGALSGGLGGSLGGTLGGAGSIGSNIDSIRSGTTGTLRSAGSTGGNLSVNRKTGTVHADRNADASVNGAIDQMVAGPARTVTGSEASGVNGSGSGSIDGQLMDTNAVRGALANSRKAASGAVRQVAGTAQGTAGNLVSTASGTLSGASRASGSADGSDATGGLVDSGNATASGSGSTDGGFQVTRGMPVLGPDGQRIGKVQRLVTNGQGAIQQMLVKIGNHTATLPAANFTASGTAVMSAMSAAQIEQASPPNTGATPAKRAGSTQVSM